jgi:hypothetical protein
MKKPGLAPFMIGPIPEFKLLEIDLKPRLGREYQPEIDVTFPAFPYSVVA